MNFTMLVHAGLHTPRSNSAFLAIETSFQSGGDRVPDSECMRSVPPKRLGSCPRNDHERRVPLSSDERAVATFRQVYRASTYRSNTDRDISALRMFWSAR